MTEEDIKKLRKLLEICQRNLDKLELQAADYGGLEKAPLHITNDFDRQKEKIANITTLLNQHGSGVSAAPEVPSAAAPVQSGEHLHKEHDHPTDAEARLVLVLEECGTLRYPVKIYLQTQPGDNFERLDNDQYFYEKGKSAKWMDEVRDEVSKQVGHKNFKVEVFVPLALLNEPIDHWPLSDDLGKLFRDNVLGARHQLTLRFLGRYSSKWQQGSKDPINWKMRREYAKPPWTKDQVLLFQNKDKDLPQARHPSILYVILGLSLAPTRKLLEGLLGAGVPALLWFRKAGKSSDLEQEIAELLATNPLSLPQEVFHRRSKKHIGYHLSILWDFPHDDLKELFDDLPQAQLEPPLRIKPGDTQ